jgi:hypothetical protein
LYSPAGADKQPLFYARNRIGFINFWPDKIKALTVEGVLSRFGHIMIIDVYELNTQRASPALCGLITIDASGSL